MKNRNVPFTKEQIKELPKGYTPAEFIGRKLLRELWSKKKIIVNITGNPEIVNNYHPNARKLTEGRKDYKQLKFGRLCGLPTINPLELLSNKLKENARAKAA